MRIARGLCAFLGIFAVLVLLGWGSTAAHPTDGDSKSSESLERLPIHPQASEVAEAEKVLKEAVAFLMSAKIGLDLGVEVHLAGHGTLFAREPDRLMPTASAIKSFVALDLLLEHGDRLHEVPKIKRLLYPGSHPAFSGFTKLELESARRDLNGMSYGELAEVMMGQTEHTNATYNIACNVLLYVSGGLEAVQNRVRAAHPLFSQIQIDHYMYLWHNNGDNLASPHALVGLYRMLSEGSVPGLTPDQVQLFRGWLRHEGDGGEGTRIGKRGTLFPSPMARIQAGYIERNDQDLIYAIMGQMQDMPGVDPSDAFVMLLAVVDTLTAICEELP